MVEKKIKIISPAWKLSDPLILKIEFPSTKKTLYQSGWNWPIGSGEGFEKSSIYFHYLLPLRKVWSLRLNKREPPLSMNCWKWPSGSWEEGFQMLSMYLCYAFEKGRDRLKKVEFPSLYCQYTLRWREFKFLSGFGEKVNAVVNAFSFFFRYISPLKTNVAIYFNKLEIHSTTDAVCQVWLKSAQWFCGGRF